MFEATTDSITVTLVPTADNAGLKNVRLTRTAPWPGNIANVCAAAINVALYLFGDIL